MGFRHCGSGFFDARHSVHRLGCSAVVCAPQERAFGTGGDVCRCYRGSCLSLFSLSTIRTGGNITIVRGWIELDPLAALLLVMIAFVYVTAALFSWGYLGGEEHRARRVRLYHANFNLFAFSMLCIPLLSEIGLVWIFVELTTLLSVLLVSYALSADALEAAWKYMVLTLLGATIAVLGVLVLFWALHATGSTDFTWRGLRAGAAHMPHALLGVAFVLLLVGYGAKIGFVPLHTWLPDAHSQAPSPVCAMLSGIETSVVLYVVLRLRDVFAGDASLHVGAWFGVVGLLSVGVAALLARADARLQAALCLFDRRAHGHHSHGRKHLYAGRRHRRALADARAHRYEVVLLLRGRRDADCNGHP